MKKRSLVSVLIIIGLMTVLLVVIGIIFDKEEFEKQQGLTSVYDISADGTIAYVYYDKGHPGIYLWNDIANPRDPIVQLRIDQEILDISFNLDGNNLAYSIGAKNKREDLTSTIHIINVKTMIDQEILIEESLITEIEYHPTNPDMLFYLKAGTYENYSPIASARPHDFDLFSYHISNKEIKQYTDLKKYSMQSLHIPSREDVAYVVMDDDEQVETAEDAFAIQQRIFEIALDGSNGYHVASQEESERDIYDFTVDPSGDAFIFQAVSDTWENGIYEYDLFLYERVKDEETQLTHLQEHTSHPVIGPDGKTVYFIVDKEFGRSNPDYYLYKMNIDGSHLEEVPLYMK